MDQHNNTPLKMAWLPGMIQPPQHSLTIIVKGCFDLTSNAKAVFSSDADAAMVTGDSYNTEESNSSLKYANDLVIFKSRADLTLTGVAYPECGKGGCTVTFSVGNWKKSLAIFNDRFWQWGRASTPEPFGAENKSGIPLVYENAFGGEKYTANPVGKGANPVESTHNGNKQPLPNIEHCDQYLCSPSQSTLPAGFGPLKDNWGDKTPLRGTYNNKWLQENYPYFPKDFDWQYFNSAPQDQQVDYLQGDEKLFFENLRPELAQFHSQLPCIRPRLFVKGQHANQDEFFQELTLRLDTLHVDMEKQQLLLSWRSVVAVQSDEFEELSHACLFVENMHDIAKSADDYQQIFYTEDANKDADFELEEFENEQGDDLAIADFPAAEKEPQEEVSVTDDASMKQIHEHFEQLKQSLKNSGLADDIVDLIGPDMDQEILQQRIFSTYNIQPADGLKLIEKSQQDMQTFLQQNESNLADFTTSEFAQEAPDNAFSDELPTDAKLAEAAVTNIDLVGADLSNRDLSNQDFTGVDFTNANFTGATISGSNFTDADLSNCILDEVYAEKAIFDHAILDGIKATNANFSGISALFTQFQFATLVKADFTDADLSNADFTQATLPKAKFSHCVLLESLFENTDLSLSQFSNINAKAVNFTGSNLLECQFSACNLREANFSDCRLSLNKITDSELSNATMENVDAEAIMMVNSNLNGIRAGGNSNFTSAQITQGSAVAIILDGANLTDAIFDNVPLQSADFSNAELVRTQFHQCDLRMAEFAKVNAMEANLSRTNLFQANFSKATLTATDFSHANLYGAEFFQATIHDSNLHHANTTQTKIALGLVK